MAWRHIINKLLERSGIPQAIILKSRKLSLVCIAQRMSWPSKRETTRVVDMAYCLLDIFNVNMPLLYGEGDKAFTHVQEEFLKTQHDHSLLG
jgi:hypothetical protein